MPYDNDFGMSSGIAVADGAIAGAGNWFVFMDQNGANGNFSGKRGGASFFESLLHEWEIGVHCWREDSREGGDEVMKQRTEKENRRSRKRRNEVGKGAKVQGR